MYKQMLVPLDGSPLIAPVVPYAQLISATIGIDIELFHVVPSTADRMRLLVEAGYGGTPDIQEIAQSILAFDQMESIHARVRNAAQEKLDQIAATFPAVAETTVRSVLGEGKPAEAIASEAAKSPGTLLVMSSHGRPGSVRWWLGSVTDRVIHLSGAPPWSSRHATGRQIYPPASRESLSHSTGRPRRSCYPPCGLPGEDVPGSGACPPDRSLGRDLVGGLGQEDLNGPIAEVKKYARKYVEDVAQRLRAEGVEKADAEVAQTHPAVAISEAAASYSQLLIVMSTHGHGGMARVTRGSVTNRCLHQGMAPILLVRP